MKSDNLIKSLKLLNLRICRTSHRRWHPRMVASVDATFPGVAHRMCLSNIIESEFDLRCNVGFIPITTVSQWWISTETKKGSKSYLWLWPIASKNWYPHWILALDSVGSNKELLGIFNEVKLDLYDSHRVCSYKDVIRLEDRLSAGLLTKWNPLSSCFTLTCSPPWSSQYLLCYFLVVSISVLKNFRRKVWLLIGKVSDFTIIYKLLTQLGSWTWRWRKFFSAFEGRRVQRE